MAETSFARLSPNSPVARAEVNYTGAPTNVAEAYDRTTHLPLHSLPPEALIPSSPPPEPPKPSESELRERLAAAIASKVEAEAAMQTATEAHERALQNVGRCQKALAGYVGLDADIDAHTLEALRSDGKADLSEALRTRLAERDVAQTELAAAERAATTLLQELGVATDAHTKSGWAVNAATQAMIELARERLRPEQHRLERKVAAYRQALTHGDGIWPEVRERLRADPLGASLDVMVPDEPFPGPPVEGFAFKNEFIDPVTGETITFQELSIRSHQRRAAAMAEETDYQRIERAKLQAAWTGGARPVSTP